MGGGQWVLHPQKPVLRARPADLEGELISNIPAVSSRSSGSFTAARAAQRRSMPALAGTMLPLDPKVKPNPLQKANVCSCLFFWWLNPLFKIGHKRKLEEDDMYSVLPEDRSQHLGEELQGYWDQEVSRAQKDAREPSLTKAILKCYGKSYLVLGMLTFLEEGTRVVLPVFLGKMVSYVENYDPTDSAALHGAYGCAAGLSACVLVWAVLHHLYFYHMQRVGMRLRVAVCHMIYRKNFLLLDEIPQLNTQLASDGKRIVDMSYFTASWDKKSGTPTLQDLFLFARPGELLAVVGPVGAGKSSLLRAVLGELPPSQGQVSVHGRIAYVPQQPWVFSGTVRSNILFGKKYEEDRYEEVIKACALGEDLQLLEDGDQTVIGDGGTPLSEGQKARVSLARAVYQNADIYLLDDPFSAVDVEVSRHLFEQCICQALREKITILVTHQWQYLKAASRILILKGGTIVQCGTYIGLLESGVDFDFLLKRNEEEPSPDLESSTLKNESRPLMRGAAPELQDTENIEVTLPLEDRLEGKVGIKTYNDYFTAGAKWFILIFLILVNTAAQVAYVLQDWWLSYWANLQSDLYFGVYGKGETVVMLHLNWYLRAYSGLTVSTILFGITRSLLIFYVLVNSSQTLHNKMLWSILRAPVLFFCRNPIGRILNRFSKDIGHMDDLLPLIFQDFIQTLLLVVGVVGVMVAAIPWTAIPVIPLGIIFFVLQWYFLRTSREVKRLECTTRSPVFSHLASSLRGLWTIRAYKAEQRFQELFDAYQDLHSEAWFLLLTTSRWLAVYLDVICAIFATAVAFGALILVETLDLGQVGLVLSLTFTFTGMFQWCVRQSAEVENMMISVERGIEYTDLEKEAPWELEHRPPPSWPHGGEIDFYHINFRYSLDRPLVLKNLRVPTAPREKLGIVGRTGAGKSSLIAALFRLSEPEGRIWIDGLWTSDIGLHDLRKKMSVALQEPVLFTGTMRKNLDPFNEYLEEELWNVLEEVQLKEAIKALPSGLDTELAESGLNLSVGQRQLVCLARTVLRKNQILILDKATSNVDPRTDEFIQKKIREKFTQCTVLTITHRLSTVIDCERILVLDSWRRREFARPYDLLQNTDSLFYKMVQKLGKAEASALTERAKQVHSESE
ncbi:ATP-binding cassette sub-family C member 4-like isoform X9 [Ovis aries]|uniref:ATP-binding cassette sub-family C member 4-like isoform X9 n=1 Tax=Ovis aries TaxID=9940 RepID=UPI00295262A0|nr:ATP-binding cassette sub-family C member 4-like isoform X9 [Ovis aries]